jgi:molybdopterin/thiamine biosynthesis adenylyltransferase
MRTLSARETIRYGRQMIIQDWGQAGQLRLAGSRVFIAGAGGLGSPAAIYLAVAGVGEIHICDADTVELSNLNRQILHTDERIGQAKALSAARTLRELNPDIHVTGSTDHLDAGSMERIVGQPDVVVDCLDNYETRYLLDDYCMSGNIPLVHGAVEAFLGQITFLQPPETPCLRCIFPQAPPKHTFPVVGATPGVIGCLQAMEVLKYLTGTGSTLKGTLLIFDGEDMTFAPIEVKRRPACPHCGHL